MSFLIFYYISSFYEITLRRTIASWLYRKCSYVTSWGVTWWSVCLEVVPARWRRRGIDWLGHPLALPPRPNTILSPPLHSCVSLSRTTDVHFRNRPRLNYAWAEVYAWPCLCVNPPSSAPASETPEFIGRTSERGGERCYVQPLDLCTLLAWWTAHIYFNIC